MHIILTHEHADAVLGLDEVWVVQPRNDRNDVEQIPIFLTQFTMDRFVFIFSFTSELKKNGLVTRTYPVITTAVNFQYREKIPLLGGAEARGWR